MIMCVLCSSLLEVAHCFANNSFHRKNSHLNIPYQVGVYFCLEIFQVCYLMYTEHLLTVNELSFVMSLLFYVILLMLYFEILKN